MKSEDTAAAHLARVKAELEILHDFGLGFALCHRDLEAMRGAVKAEQQKLARLIASIPDTPEEPKP